MAGLADVVADLAFSAVAAVVEVRPEVMEPAFGVGEQVEMMTRMERAIVISSAARALRLPRH
jgi:hypothetical protein